jgi:hypothetical protein
MPFQWRRKRIHPLGARDEVSPGNFSFLPATMFPVEYALAAGAYSKRPLTGDSNKPKQPAFAIWVGWLLALAVRSEDVF